MNKKLFRLLEDRAAMNSMQATRIQQLITDSIDPKMASDLIFEVLHTDRNMRDINRAIEIEVERGKKPWWERIFAP